MNGSCSELPLGMSMHTAHNVIAAKPAGDDHASLPFVTQDSVSQSRHASPESSFRNHVTVT
jgi:hypothetical protein